MYGSRMMHPKRIFTGYPDDDDDVYFLLDAHDLNPR